MRYFLFNSYLSDYNEFAEDKKEVLTEYIISSIYEVLKSSNYEKII